MKISVIVTTYNSPAYLRLCLQSLLAQSRPGRYEILVADDGSGPETEELVRVFFSDGRPSIHHVWQEDLGFRPGAIRNRAAAKANGEYLVFLDGDCVTRKHFLRNYRKLVRESEMIAGERVNLSEPFSGSVIDEQLPIHRWSRFQWIKERISGNIDRVDRILISMPDGPHRLLQRDNWTAAASCNFGVKKTDFLGVNGYDELFEGWGYEDWDLAQRLSTSGLRLRDGRFSLAVFHLWHRERSRQNAAKNRARLEERKESGLIRAERGVDQYL